MRLLLAGQQEDGTKQASKDAQASHVRHAPSQATAASSRGRHNAADSSYRPQVGPVDCNWMSLCSRSVNPGISASGH